MQVIARYIACASISLHQSLRERWEGEWQLDDVVCRWYRYIACTSISLLSEPAGDVEGGVGGLVTG